jgi:hypothetical protein
MDHWDPAVTDGFAKDREVILFDNAGISSSSGEVPTSIEEMAGDGFVTSANGTRNKSSRTSGSSRSNGFAPRLHRRCSESSVRSC